MDTDPHHDQSKLRAGFAYIVLGITLLTSGCSFPEIPFFSNYEISHSESLGIYVRTCGDPSVDKVFRGAFYLELMAKGYNTIDFNHLLDNELDTLTPSHHAVEFDSLLKKQYLPLTTTIFIAQPRIDSTDIVTDVRQISKTLVSYHYFRVPILYTEFVAFDVKTRKKIFSTARQDTLHLYKAGYSNPISEQLWMLAARQISTVFDGLPICQINNMQAMDYNYPVNFYVDKSYREQFPSTWKQRLQLRMLYVNDIYNKRYRIGFFINHFYEWDEAFVGSLVRSAERLQEITASQPNEFNIGITLNGALKFDWRDRNTLGLAPILGHDAVITAQPSFPGLFEWNSVEESLTLIHEIGHLFGAMHSIDTSSIMFPTSGSLSYQFDYINASILQHTKRNFFHDDGEKRTRQYLEALSEIRRTPYGNTYALLDIGCSAIARNYFHSLIPGSTSIERVIESLTKDTAFQLGLRGYFAYKMGDYLTARKCLLQAVSEEPNYSEAHWYLHKIYQVLDEKPLAEEQLRLARRYGLPRFEEHPSF